MVVRAQEIRVSSIKPLGAAEAEQLSVQLTRSMVSLLEQLSQEEWEKPTDCELWRVRDMIAHLVGWNEALVSPKEMGGQGVAAFRQRKELGNLVDAQNQVQVDARRALSTTELIERMNASGGGAARRRHSMNKLLGWIPFHMNYMGGWITVGYLLNTIFPRDSFMHRIDITRATARDFEVGPADQRILDDIVRDWFKRSRAQARLELTGTLGGTYVSVEEPLATLRADGLEFIRMLFGRADKTVVQVEGDQAAARRWLDTFFPV